MRDPFFHPIAWNKEKIARFWDHYVANPSHKTTYFSQQFGEEIVDLTSARIKLSGNVLDFGCGPGFLLQELIQRRISCHGLDFSEESVSIVNDKFQNNPLFKGARAIQKLPSSFADNSFDAVFFLETLEHLLPEDTHLIMTELSRIMKPQSHLILTVPNCEDLDFKKTACPDCGAEFHTMQHLTNWNHEKLKDFLGQWGFSTVFSHNTFLFPRLILPGRMYSRIFSLLYKLGIGGKIIQFLPFGTGQNLPHLLFIAKKEG